MNAPVHFPDMGEEPHGPFREPKPLSQVLVEAVSGPTPRLTLGELVGHLSSRGLAPLILLMGMINVVTIIPGSSTVLGLPLVFLGLALLVGARTLWLPASLRDRSFDRAALQRGVERALPYLQRIERLAHPRLWPWGQVLLDRIYGAIVLFLGLMVTLPVPFGNTMPAISIILLSLGFTARDGLWVVAGLFTTVLALGIVLGFAGAATVVGASLLGY
ncbi:exopolysaccharide biosynthesis protein [Defluviimonas salinarum]|uniref:Exopolysaccharide biosynthesis protein n=1 Tax=Defluviimonas salinarum TaxID=2992147 RepID=A0ABT3J3Z2_9RHOB|nr:exopolysaccharide biosynthesis protein [Defluviimonas salinarum]MCW3782381.1 exopolysaccharide biosynthesis protein [Defluviimonas salinarum]